MWNRIIRRENEMYFYISFFCSICEDILYICLFFKFSSVILLVVECIIVLVYISICYIDFRLGFFIISGNFQLKFIVVRF